MNTLTESKKVTETSISLATKKASATETRTLKKVSFAIIIALAYPSFKVNRNEGFFYPKIQIVTQISIFVTEGWNKNG